MATMRSQKRSSTKRSGDNGVLSAAAEPVAKVVATALKKTRGAARDLQHRVATMMPAVGEYLYRTISLEFESLRDLYLKELEDLLSAEHQLLKALPEMAKAANSQPLRTAFRAHLSETKVHVQRLEKVFAGLGHRPHESKCKAMAGLIAEGDQWIRQQASPGVMDAGLIAAAQRVEHYEIAGYGCVRTYAELLGDKKSAALLQQTLDEEAAADKKLTQLSKKINVQAESDLERAAVGRMRKAPAHRRKATSRSKAK